MPAGWQLVAISGVILAGYLLYEASSGNRDGVDAVRRSWVSRILRSPGQEILAVQTLRNSLMAASLMASTAAVVLMAVVSVGVARAAPNTSMDSAMLFLPVLLLLASLVLFSRAVRLYHRAGYTLALSDRSDDRSGGVHATAFHELSRGAMLYRAGWRAFHGALAMSAWLISPWLTLGATILIVAVDYFAEVHPTRKTGI
jgi:uncharacterized membrane protein